MSEDSKRPIVTGMGYPGVEKKLLSADDEKLVDDKGNLVVTQAPWSKVPTGLYLTIFGWHGLGTFKNGGHYTQLPPRLTLMVAAGIGKPTLPIEGWGACLELPSDLARDDLKKQYVTEWVIDTAKEILSLSRSYIPNDQMDGFATWLLASTNQEIRMTGL